MSTSTPQRACWDGNEAAAHVAYATNEIIAIYPITPSTPMAESCDDRASRGRKNLWGVIPSVVEMQSEGGVAGAIHGALTTGSLCTTFTASQGLLLMIPNMFKIAGELTPCVFHVAARALATNALSIFGDHSDVMAARSTGWAMLCSNNPQEAMDLALVSQIATLRSRLPFMHFFDGFRTSHEIRDVEILPDDVMRELLPEDLMAAHRERGLSPDHPAIRGTAHNPDTFFQTREASNPFYTATPQIVQEAMNAFAAKTGRHYGLFDYVGHPEADRVVILMGSGADTAENVAADLNAKGERVGVLKVRLFRPFDAAALVAALPPSVEKVAVLDRCKEPGSAGEPLYQDVVAACHEEGHTLHVTGGRYGLGSKDFTPAMAKAVFDHLAEDKPKRHFTVGIRDDVSHTSLDWDEAYQCDDGGARTALFFGLGSDGTVGANKNSIKIIGDATGCHVQAYFVYDSKKSGSMTVSHLRFSNQDIRASYLIDEADFVGCHNFAFLEGHDLVGHLKPGGTFLLNAPYGPEEVWSRLPRTVQEALIAKRAKVYTVDAYAVARKLGLGGRINVIMQTAFFLISGVVPAEEALPMIEKAVRKTYGNKGQSVVDMNLAAVQQSKENIFPVEVPAAATSEIGLREWVPADAPDFIRNVTAPLMAGKGDEMPVSSLPLDGTWPVGTARYEKRRIATHIPVWDSETCIQCNLCSFVCPHATIRAKAIAPETNHAPEGFTTATLKGKNPDGLRFRIQVAPEDCTGCGACVHVCPAFAKDASGQKTDRRAINMAPIEEHLTTERANWDYFVDLPEVMPPNLKPATIKGSQFKRPLFEFSGACAGCGETPYIKLLTQLFGQRLLIANATGCSSIYGGNLPTTPYTTGADGRGPAWSNSLFEDAAEFGLGMRLTHDALQGEAFERLKEVASRREENLLDGFLAEAEKDEDPWAARYDALARLRAELEGDRSVEASRLRAIADHLIDKSVWIIGGDGWAYDIGYGGLDHVLASGRNVNILVLDTGVYSNTGGQASKATPKGAIAKFAAAGKSQAAKDLGGLAMAYGSVYVARIAFGANMAQTVNALREAEAYNGPSLVIAYAHCIAHGIDMSKGTDVQKMAVDTGFWPLYRYQPDGEGSGKLSLDSKAPKEDVEQFMFAQNRFKLLRRADPDRANALLDSARKDVATRWTNLERLSESLSS